MGGGCTEREGGRQIGLPRPIRPPPPATLVPPEVGGTRGRAGCPPRSDGYITKGNPPYGRGESTVRERGAAEGRDRPISAGPVPSGRFRPRRRRERRGGGSAALPDPTLVGNLGDPLREGSSCQEKRAEDGEDRRESRLASLGLGPSSVMVTDLGRPQ